MKFSLKKIPLAGAALLLALFVLPRGASALTISPAFVDHVLNPGDTVIETLKIFNHDARPITLFPLTQNFTAGEDEGGTPKFYAAELDPYGSALAPWITLDSTKPIVLQPEERANLIFTINVPRDAQPGSHFGAVVLGTTPPDVSGQKTTVGVESQIAELVFVKVSGEAKEIGGVAEFGFSRPQVWFNYKPIDMFARFENSGNTHLRPTGNVLIYNWLGRQTGAITVNAEFKSVLPKSIRRFDFAWGEGQAGAGTVKRGFLEEMGEEWRNFAVGPYRALLVLNYGSDNKIVTSEINFSVWPWRLMTVCGCGLLVLLVLLWLLLKLYNRSVIRGYEKMKNKEAAAKK